MKEPEVSTETEGANDPAPFTPSRDVRRIGIRGSRAPVSRMAARRKAPPSLATHLAVRAEDGSITRIWHPDYLRKMEERASADAVADAGKGGRR